MKRKLLITLFSAAMAGTLFLTGCTGSDVKKKEAAGSTEVSGTEKDMGNPDQKAADHVAELIDDIYVQERNDNTDQQCKEAKEAWDALTETQKELVEGENADPDYF